MTGRTAGKRRRFNSVSAWILIAAMLLFTLAGCTPGVPSDPGDAAAKTGAYVLETTPSPTISSGGGEWAVMGLCKSGAETEDYYYEGYYDNVRAAVKSRKGILSEDTYTEYARVTLALCFLGKDPGNVEGYDLTAPLDDYKIVTDQGLNAAAFALLAANVSGRKLENEDNYIAYILSELEAGNLYSNSDASDYVAIALEGLSFYTEREDVKAAVEKGISALSEFQNPDGSFGNCESTAEAIVALTQLGISVTEDARFIKGENSLWDGLMKYYMKNGAFCHVTEEEEANAMATEKALLALDAILLSENGKTLYEGGIL